MVKVKTKKQSKKQQKNSSSKPAVAAKKSVSSKRKARSIGKKNVEKQQKSTTKPKKRVVGRPFPKGVSGNPKGRPKLGCTNFDNLLRAVRNVENKEGKKLLEHFIGKGFANDTVLVAVMKKLYPDLKSVEQVTYSDSSMSNQEAEDIRKELFKRFRGKKRAVGAAKT